MGKDRPLVFDEDGLDLLRKTREKETNWLELFKQRPYLTTIALVGLLLIAGGVALMTVMKSGVNSEGVEVVKVNELTGEKGQIFIDVAGAVIKPGMYQLEIGARLNDALVVAGGLASQADRDWFSKNMNLALKLTDGQKIYIPYLGETGVARGGQVAGAGIKSKININSASLSELDSLWGVGEATAKKIVDGRPYGTVEELLTKKAVKANVYERIKDEVSVY